MKRGKTVTLSELRKLAKRKGCGVDPLPSGSRDLQLFWLKGLHCVGKFYIGTYHLSRSKALRLAFAAISALPDIKPAPKAGKGDAK